MEVYCPAGHCHFCRFSGVCRRAWPIWPVFHPHEHFRGGWCETEREARQHKGSRTSWGLRMVARAGAGGDWGEGLEKRRGGETEQVYHIQAEKSIAAPRDRLETNASERGR